jgi:hypothetical protein
MSTHKIVSVEMGSVRTGGHDTVVSVSTCTGAQDIETHWTLSAVLKAMSGAERFYTQASNGRQARIQRYTCAKCRSEHIRTHVSDVAIDDVQLHRRARAAH